MMATLRRATWILCLAIGVPPSQAQRLDPAWLDGLTWRGIGPAVTGGRIDDVAIDDRNPSIVYVGTASGGLWKSVNRGTTWTPVLDRVGAASIGDVALAPSNSNVVWVGTGEPNNRQSSTFGTGAYRSTDGGRTWTHTGLEDTHHIGRVLIDPSDADVVYVAALGHLWGANDARGVYKTVDGGDTWERTHFIDADTGAVDLAMDPRDSRVIYAAMYQRRRTPWGFNGGGPGSGLYKTSDAGRSWTRLTGGLPDGPLGRIGLAIARSRPDVVYATIEHGERGGIYRTDDAGASWRRVNTLNPRPMYYSKIFVDPTDAERVYVLGSSFYVSIDGAATFADPVTGEEGANESMTPTYDVGVHGDHHTLWIDPRDPAHLVLGGDGGLYVSHDGSASWTKINNLPIAQAYGIGVDSRDPYFVYAGLQDNHSWGGPSQTRYHVGITNADWYQINFGDGMYAQVDPSDAETVYTESQGGNLIRFNRRTGDRRNIKPQPADGEPAYRFNWTSPIHISPHDSRIVYLGGNRLFISEDRGDSWRATPDLTRGEDRNELPIMGVLPGPETLSRHDGVADWGTITTVAESPVTRNVIWVGTDDGLVQLSRDGGATWSDVSARLPVPDNLGRVSRVEPSPHAEGTAYVALDRHERDDFRPYLFVTTDSGGSWRSLAEGLPEQGWINVVKEHPGRPGVLAVGTETGLHLSVDGGTTWVRPQGGIPPVPVDDLIFHPREGDLVVGTHGRSIWILDDTSPLAQLTPETLQQRVHLFEPRRATLRMLWKQESYSAQGIFAGPNPPPGALLTYFLAEPAAGPPTVEIADATGAVIRRLAGTARAGLNRLSWDLRAGPPDGADELAGPLVPPGRYTVRVLVGEAASAAPLDVRVDPDYGVEDEELKTRYELLRRLNVVRADLQAHARAIQRVRGDLEALRERMAGHADRTAAIDAAVGDVERTSADLRRELEGSTDEATGERTRGLRARADGLFGAFEGSGVQQGSLSAPTAAQTRELEALAAAADRLRQRLEGDLLAQIQAANAALSQHGIPHIGPLPPARPPQ